MRLYGGPTVGSPLCQPLPPGMPGYVRYCPYTREADASGTYQGPDLPRARALVAASGRKGARVVVEAVSDAFTIPPAEPAYIADVLRSLGFKVTIHTVRLNSITPEERRSFQLSVDGDWLPDFPTAASFLPPFFECRGPRGNHYDCNPALDRLMRRATLAAASNPRLAARLWAQADHEITDQAYWLPTLNLNEVDLVSPRLRNYEYNPVWGFLADQAWVR
jgi:peptide/nickel transport system substrate-binding protein